MTQELAAPGDIPAAEGWRLRVVGEQLVVLRGPRDPRQAWLPFVHAVLCDQSNLAEGNKPVAQRSSGEKLSFRWASDRRIDPGPHRVLYEHVRDVPQILLPFEEFRRISTREWRRITLADHPSFERLPDGRLPMITFHPANFAAVLAWCQENSRGRFFCARQFAGFERLHDAVLAKLAVPDS